MTAASVPVRKVGGIVVGSEELFDHSDPAAETVLRDIMIDSYAAFMDAHLISSTAAVTDTSPAVLRADATTIASTDDPAADVQALLGGFVTLDGVSIIASELTAIALAVAMPGAIQNGALFGIIPVSSRAPPAIT